MSIEKLEEFARDGQKNTDELILTDGFPRPKFPARQWFNYLFNMLSLKINEIIELDPVARSEIIDNLTTNDADKVASARTVQELEDKKLNKTDLVNDLTSGGSKKILSAEMGKELQNKKLEKIFAIDTPLNVTSSRAPNVTYTNPSSKYYLQVCISGYRSGANLVDFILNGEKFGSIGQSSAVNLTTSITVLVPPLGEYSINNQLTGMYWSEM